MEKAQDKSENPDPKRRKKVFKNFAEYWHFVKILSEDQRRQIVSELSTQEQKALRASYDKGGWEDLFMRNACDQQLAYIKESYGVDLLSVRCHVLAGKPQLMQKSFWKYVNTCFDRIPWEHISYIFDGMVAADHDEGYVKLSRYVRPSA